MKLHIMGIEIPKRLKRQPVFVMVALIVPGVVGEIVCTQGSRTTQLWLEPCVFVSSSGDSVAAEWGRFLVPENRKSDSTRNIQLSFVRFQGTAQEPGPPIVYLAGGPGGSGIEAARSKRFPLFMALREIGDVIAFDQRGTGASEPDLSCPGSRYAYPLNEPLTREKWLRLEERAAELCIDSLVARGVDLRGYTTAESAWDLDALRQALGEEKVSLLGISYGTHLGLAAIRQFPHRIHRAILAGVEGVDHTFMVPTTQEEHLKFLAVEAAKQEIVEYVPDLLKAIDSVLTMLDEAPVPVEVPGGENRPADTVVIGKFDVQFRTAMMLNTRNWDVPRVYGDMLQKDFSFVAAFMRNFRKFQGVGGLELLMECASGASSLRLLQIKRERDANLLADARNFPFPELCEVVYRRVPALRLPDSFRQPVESDVPVLFVSGTFDGVTPFTNAVETARGFPHGQHLVIQGAQHSNDLLISSPLIAEEMLRFMRGQPPVRRVLAVPFEFATPRE